MNREDYFTYLIEGFREMPTVTEAEEKDLLLRARHGNREAFHRLFTIYIGDAVPITRRVVPRWADASEAMAEAQVLVQRLILNPDVASPRQALAPALRRLWLLRRVQHWTPYGERLVQKWRKRQQRRQFKRDIQRVREDLIFRPHMYPPMDRLPPGLDPATMQTIHIGVAKIPEDGQEHETGHPSGEE